MRDVVDVDAKGRGRASLSPALSSHRIPSLHDRADRGRIIFLAVISLVDHGRFLRQLIRRLCQILRSLIRGIRSRGYSLSQTIGSVIYDANKLIKKNLTRNFPHF